MVKSAHKSTATANNRPQKRRTINTDRSVTTFDGVIPTIGSTVRIMTPGNGYLKFGVVRQQNLDQDLESGIPDVRVQLYNGDCIVRPRNQVRVYSEVNNHFYDFTDHDGKYLSVGDKIEVLTEGYFGRVEELLPTKVWIKKESGEYSFEDHDELQIMEEYPNFIDDFNGDRN